MAFRPSDPVPVAVVGAGQLGSRHARVYSQMAGVRLVGVADLDRDRADAVAASCGARAAVDLEELVGEVQAASVAVPTVSHCEVTKRLLEAGIHVLVEKPIAASLAEAAEMIAEAKRRSLVLAVGHTERYNPGVEALLDSVREPRFIEVHRLGSFSPRSLDIDVVLDLMIHDLDVVAALVREEVRSLEAVGVAVLTPRIDIANARLRFENGCVANLTASRVSREKVRKLRIFEKARYVSLDYQNQEAMSYRLVAGSGPRPEICTENLTLANQEPLRRELDDFLRAVQSGGRPRVAGEDGLRALELALRVAEAMAPAPDA